ncbi:MAG: hypothetical protein R6X14_01385 [bacterium]
MRMLVVLLACFGLAAASLYHIDQPVPRSLAHAEYYVSARLWGQGGALMRVGIGLFDRLTLGVAYGGDRLVGYETPLMYNRPEFFGRGAILLEQGFFPDLVVGFESQGFDSQGPDGDYGVLPKGGFLSIGKTIEPTRTYLQAAVNYWDGVSGFAVANQYLPGGFEMVLEYDLATNDNRQGTGGRGFLNAGIGWTFNDQFRFGLALRDIVGNRPDFPRNRVLDISFHDLF